MKVHVLMVWFLVDRVVDPKTIGSEAFQTILLQGHNQFYGVITFSQRYQQTVYLGKIF